MKKNNNKVQKILFIFLILVFAGLAIFMREQKVYEHKLVDEIYNMVPSNGAGVSMKKGERNISLETETGYQALSMKPGDVFEGTLVVKNHESHPDNFNFTLFGDLSPKNGGIKPIIELEDTKFSLDALEWGVHKYKIIIPEDIEMGDYLGTVTVSNDTVTDNGNGVGLIFAVGVEFKINVSDDPIHYEYQNLVDPDLSLKKWAFDTVLMDLKRIVGGLFAILAVVFLYLAVVSDKKKSKAKKKK